MTNLTQEPKPGNRVLKYQGDLAVFELKLSEPRAGRAYLRNNLVAIYGRHGSDDPNSAAEENHNAGWQDVEMKSIGASDFRIVMPLFKVGNFEFKTVFFPDDSDTAIWPDGENTFIKVDPAGYCSANIIYNAFVRQFESSAIAASDNQSIELGNVAESIRTLDALGYTVIPPSGSFRGLKRELKFIIDELGCRIIQLLPIFPTPTSYGRMGRFGSAFASLDFTSVDPALAEMDSRTTPLEQLIEVIDEIHLRNARVFLDIAINHTGWGSRLHIEHPEWFVRNDDGSFYSPRAWGVTWEDLIKLDYQQQELWGYIANVFRVWCCRGVDGFRCDAAYMVPIEVWRFIVDNVRDEFPDTIFILEGLGGSLSTTRQLLSGGGLNWAYSELFQNYNRFQIDNYLPGATRTSSTDGLMVHFAETHDNDRLAVRSPEYARLRTALCALTSCNGAYGFANGVEWYAKEKIDVHGSPAMNWGNELNQVDWISKLNTLLKRHPVFQKDAVIRFIHDPGDDAIACYRYHEAEKTAVLVLVNLDDVNKQTVRWKAMDLWVNFNSLVDLLTGDRIEIEVDGAGSKYCLAPGEVRCLANAETNPDFQNPNSINSHLCDFNTCQQLQSKAMEVLYFYTGIDGFDGSEIGFSGSKLYEDPIGFCQRANGVSDEPGVIQWRLPEDSEREVMVPPNCFLYISCPKHFVVQLAANERLVHHAYSMPSAVDTQFALFPPLAVPHSHLQVTLKAKIFEPKLETPVTGHLLYLTLFENTCAKQVFEKRDLPDSGLYALSANNIGSVAIANIEWGKLNSRYDALLAANLCSDYPADRCVFLSRCRIWVVYCEHSFAVSDKYLQRIEMRHGYLMVWEYLLDLSENLSLQLKIGVSLSRDKNEVRIEIDHRFVHRNDRASTPKDCIWLVARPEIDDRSAHELTKAHTRGETCWDGRVQCSEAGFQYASVTGSVLSMKMSDGSFNRGTEWSYGVHYSHDDERGHDAVGDLFSPGYFRCELAGNDSIVLEAATFSGSDQVSEHEITKAGDLSGGAEIVPSVSISSALLKSMDDYLVARGEYETVIAGYPWFLDWGRDSLICVRGIIAAGKITTARRILSVFAQYEKKGMLPNVIRGSSIENWDTSDAPLWFIVACSDLVRAENTSDFLDHKCGARTVLEVIESIIENYRGGTPNGIRMDIDSGLIYSPSHFTWMDTNYPAGTPRAGYPIEIQALWSAALDFALAHTRRRKWKGLAKKIKKSIVAYYFDSNSGYLSDCLHAAEFTPAAKAYPDDALRPNQLLALTLNAVDDPSIARRILNACERLLVPGGIRSLADIPVRYPLPVEFQGKLLNDPVRPYWGKYIGDEDTRRKPAYHNGTAWTWLFPSFSEAWVCAYGTTAAVRETALSILGSSEQILNSGCINHIPEIMDGNYPHAQRGCMAQAWGTTELYRVIKLLSN